MYTASISEFREFWIKLTFNLVFYMQMFAAVSAHFVNAQVEYRPEFKDYRNSDGQTLVNIDNPETRQQQYHTVDFNRSKYFQLWIRSNCICLNGWCGVYFAIGSYGYGYNVSPDGQFHHETRGPDGVVYILFFFTYIYSFKFLNQLTEMTSKTDIRLLWLYRSIWYIESNALCCRFAGISHCRSIQTSFNLSKWTLW